METAEVHVARNVRRFREERRYTVRALSARLSELGRPILPSGITKIEDGSRRVDVGDLVALALALDVSPVALLLPHEPTGDGVQLTPNVTVNWQAAWRWAHGAEPITDEPLALHDPKVAEFREENRPYEGSPIVEVGRFVVPLVARTLGPSFTLTARAVDGKFTGQLASPTPDEEAGDG